MDAAIHSRISILLAVPNDLTRLGLRALLRKDARFEVLDDTSGDMLDAATRLRPSLVLIDPGLADDLDSGVADSLRGASPQCAIVIIATTWTVRLFGAAMLSHASGLFLETFAADSHRLLDALALISQSGAVILDPALGDRLWSGAGEHVTDVQMAKTYPTLTERDTAILRGIAAGLSERQVARFDGIGPSTVKRTLAALEKRFEVRSRFALALKLGHLRLIDS